MRDSIKNRIPILDLKKQYGILKNEDLNDSIRYLVGFTLVFSTLYFVAPIDVIPDVLLGLGYLDDLTIYAFLREVGYKGAEMDSGIKEATFKVLSSRMIAIAAFALFILIGVIGIATYFLVI